MDQNVLHPFVRIHIVDMNTNKYLAKDKPSVPGVSNIENCSFFKMELDKEGKLIKTPCKISTDFFLPMSTRMHDMRILGTNYCNWNEEFIINENVANIYKKNVVILFELLEFNPLLVADQSSLLRPDKLYPVAWGYLRPLGTGSVHMDKIKL